MRNVILALVCLTSAAWLVPCVMLSDIVGHSRLKFGMGMLEVMQSVPASKKWSCRTNPDGVMKVCSGGIDDIDGIREGAVGYVDGKVVKVLLITNLQLSSIDLLVEWNKYMKIFSEKHGKPDTLVETMPREEFIRVGLEAVGAGQCHFATCWTSRGNGVSMTMRPGWIEIAYESKRFRDIARKSEAGF